MSNAREKAEGFTKQVIGQMIGDDLLVEEGKEQERKAKGHSEERAEQRPEARKERPASSRRSRTG